MSSILFIVSFFAGLLGSLSGLGGGIVIVPLLLYGFGVALPYAIGASLLSVVATSVATTAILLPKGFTHLRLSLFLETASVGGAIFGATIAPKVPLKIIALLFSSVLFFAAYQGFRGPPRPRPLKEDGHDETAFNLSFQFLDKHYEVQNRFLTWLSMGIGGILSGLLGIGSGSFNVVILERLMGVPLAIATATSSSIIGVTAAASGYVYYEKGLMDPALIFPLVPGVVLGSFLGGFLLPKLSTHALRLLFSTLVLLMGFKMLWGAF